MVFICPPSIYRSSLYFKVSVGVVSLLRFLLWPFCLDFAPTLIKHVSKNLCTPTQPSVYVSGCLNSAVDNYYDLIECGCSTAKVVESCGLFTQENKPIYTPGYKT